jgi:hypothetical protein
LSSSPPPSLFLAVGAAGYLECAGCSSAPSAASASNSSLAAASSSLSHNKNLRRLVPGTWHRVALAVDCVARQALVFLGVCVRQQK